MKRHIVHLFKQLGVALWLGLVVGSTPAVGTSVPLQELYRNREQVTTPSDRVGPQISETVSRPAEP